MHGAEGNDNLFGGTGLDFAVYARKKEDYAISSGEGYIIVSANAGGSTDSDTDRLEGIERLVFANINIAFDLDGNAGLAVKVLGAFIGAEGVSDLGLVGYVLNLLDDGMSYDGLLQLAIDTIFGSESEGSTIVRHFYRALTGGDAPDDLVAEWGGKIDSGELSTLELTKLVAENEQNLANIDFVGLASTGIEYLTA